VADLSDLVSPLRIQKCRFTTPQDAGIIVLSMGGMGYSLICLKSPDPTIEFHFQSHPHPNYKVSQYSNLSSCILLTEKNFLFISFL
jgi:hypothetical protein